jgi:TonB-dependent starch-binding outer membrane protein SusC
MKNDGGIEKSWFSELMRSTARSGTFFLFILLFIMSTGNSFSQGRRITGKVTDAAGNSIPGVTVLVEGTLTGVFSDPDGNYSIQVGESARVLLFSFVGMKTERVEIEGRTVVDIVLQQDLLGLDEVVVIGYGTVRREEITTAISSVQEKDFNIGTVKNAADLIQGKVAGLSITSPSGDPAASAQIMLRGITSIFSGTTPLILIDGVPGDLNAVAPQDIESINVLKDGAAAAIYGTRGTNGVILITTKSVRGRMRTTIDYDTYYNVQQIARRPELLDASDYKRLIAEGVYLVDHGHSTDWVKEIMRPSPFSQMHNVSFKGGDGASSYVGNFNIRDAQGLIIGSGVDQITGRINAKHAMFNEALVFNIGLMGREINMPRTDGDASFMSAYRQAIIRNPTDRVVDDKGNWINREIYMYDNPVALIEESNGYNKERNFRYFGEVTLKPVPEFQAKLLMSRNQTNRERAYFRNSRNPASISLGQKGYASRDYRNSVENLLELTLEYLMETGQHRASLLGGYSYQDYLYEDYDVSNYDFPSDVFSFDNLALGAALQSGKATMGSFRSTSRLAGFFGRANYNYANKYIMMGSLRYEASSKFGKDYQWGLFPSLSAAWRVSQEPFMKNLGIFDDFKLRAGYGVTGTEPDSPYLSLTRLRYGTHVLIDGKWIRTIVPSSNPNSALRWEKKIETNVGVDMVMFNRRASLTVDLYRRETMDMLWNFSVPVPPYLFSTIIANVGRVENKGIEAILQVVPVQKQNFEWTTTAIFDANKNKLVSLSDELYQSTSDFFYSGYTGPPIQQSTHRIEIGGPIGNFWAWKVVDIDENGRWIVEKPNGELIPSSNKTPGDKQVVGNGLPSHYLSWNNTFRYKNLQLDVRMRGAFGFQILNFNRMFYENPSSANNYNNLKTGFDLVFDKVRLSETQELVSYYVEDGDYWKVDNVALGYEFTNLGVDFISRARVYVSGQNLLTITGYKGLDPEVNRMGLSPGLDPLNKFPTTRTYTLGMSVTF